MMTTPSIEFPLTDVSIAGVPSSVPAGVLPPVTADVPSHPYAPDPDEAARPAVDSFRAALARPFAENAVLQRALEDVVRRVAQSPLVARQDVAPAVVEPVSVPVPSADVPSVEAGGPPVVQPVQGEVRLVTRQDDVVSAVVVPSPVPVPPVVAPASVPVPPAVVPASDSVPSPVVQVLPDSVPSPVVPAVAVEAGAPSAAQPVHDDVPLMTRRDVVSAVAAPSSVSVAPAGVPPVRTDGLSAAQPVPGEIPPATRQDAVPAVVSQVPDSVPPAVVPAIPESVPPPVAPAVPDAVPPPVVPTVPDAGPSPTVRAVADVVPSPVVPTVPDAVPPPVVPAPVSVPSSVIPPEETGVSLTAPRPPVRVAAAGEIVAEETVADETELADAVVSAGVRVADPAVYAAVPQAVEAAVPVTAVDTVTAAFAPAAVPAQETFLAAANAVADVLLVSPGLLRGEGEIRVQLRPDVLEGTEVRISVAGRQLDIAFVPRTPDVAVLIEQNRPQLEQHLAARFLTFRLSVGVLRRTSGDTKGRIV